jgi:hypothetical protein
MVIRIYSLWICLISLCLVASNAFAADPMAQLVGMAKKIAELKEFSVSTHMAYDIVQKSGQKIEFSEIRHTLISRPNHMRVDGHQSDGDVSRLFFDGKTLTLVNATENVYSQTDRPGDLDGAIRYAVGTLGIRVPMARLLVTTLPRDIQKMTSNVEYVERNILGGTATEHIAGQTDEVDYQVWIAEDNLPRRIVITYKRAPGQPQFSADFSDWNLLPKVADAAFNFTPPKGAEKIPILLSAGKLAVMVESQGGE